MESAGLHLRALARQSRLLSRRAADGQRARQLLTLAELYEKQAADL
jgi:hypothetical protein